MIRMLGCGKCGLKMYGPDERKLVNRMVDHYVQCKLGRLS